MAWESNCTVFQSIAFSLCGGWLNRRKETDMTRYVVTRTCIAFGHVTIYSFSNEKLAIEKMAKLDKDPRYTYTYEIERS